MLPITISNKMTVFPQPLAEYNTDLSNELNAKQFAEEHGFYLACTAKIKHKDRFIKNPDVNPIEYVPTKGREEQYKDCLLYTSPSPRDKRQSRMPSSA